MTFGGHLPARLVRGSGTVATPVVTPDSTSRTVGSFVLNGDTALDRRTGLLWQRCSAGQHLIGANVCGGVPRTYTLQKSRALAHDGWRLPSVDELKTLIDTTTHPHTAPYLNTEVFPLREYDPHEYWTATPFGNTPNKVFCGDFNLAYHDNCGSYPQAARLVRSMNKS